MLLTTTHRYPIESDMFTYNYDAERYTQFDGCNELATVDIAGGGEINKTISHLSLERWRKEMNQEINRINQILPTSHINDKATMIQEWTQSVLRLMEQYKAEHNNLLKEATTLLELALWKVNLEKIDGGELLETKAKKAKIDCESARQGKRVTSGVDIIIKNVLPFLALPNYYE